MEGLERIIARIEEDSEAELAEAKQRNEKDCADILTQYREKADAAYQQMLTSARQELLEQSERTKRNAKMDAEKAILACKQQLIDAAFCRAGKMLQDLPEKDYIDFLSGLAGHAAANGQESVILNSADRAAFGHTLIAKANRLCRLRGLPDHLTLAEETRNFSGGVVLKSGNVETNCTIASLLSQYRATLAAEVAAILFENGKEGATHG